jgi:hypothetical protein
MEQIEQLKAMRDAAKARIEALPDFRLMTSLTALIDDLEKALGMGEQSAEAADAPAAEPAGGEGGADSGASATLASASAVSVLALAIAEPTAPAVESEIAAVIPEIDPIPVQAAPEPEPEPGPEPEPDIEYESASPSPLVAAAEALSDLDSLPSEEAIQVLEAVEEALTADVSTQPEEYETDEFETEEFDTEEQQEEPVSYVSTLGLSESEEEAVNRALAELSVDLDEDFEEEPEPVLRPSVLRR